MATRKKNWKSVCWATVGVVLVGLMTHALWDIVLKPGLTGVGRFFLDTVTFGNETVKNRAYSSAALNPTPLAASSSNFMMNLILYCVLGAMAGMALRRRFPLTDKMEGDRRFALAALFVILVTAVIGNTILCSIVDQSVTIWRVFNADVAICAPYLTDKEEKQLRARFAAMKTRAEYQPIAEELNRIAETNGVALREEKLW